MTGPKRRAGKAMLKDGVAAVGPGSVCDDDGGEDGGEDGGSLGGIMLGRMLPGGSDIEIGVMLGITGEGEIGTDGNEPDGPLPEEGDVTDDGIPDFEPAEDESDLKSNMVGIE